MRILLTSIGRRSYLADYFRDALDGEGEVWGGDCSRYAPAFMSCDRALLLPRVDEPGYADHLLALCRRERIDILVPLIDPELIALAPFRDQFFDADIMLLLSPPRTIGLASDKLLTYEFGSANNLPVPNAVATIEEARERIHDGRLSWPVVVKPRFGSASAHISYCHDMDQLRRAYESCPQPFVQEHIDGTEYGFDLFGDQLHQPVSVFCKQKLAMRAGETDKAISTDDPALLAIGRRLAEAFAFFGPIDADVIVGDQGPNLLEINPRFGGGYPCSHAGGADFPRRILRMQAGEALTPDTKPGPAGICMFKQDAVIIRSRADVQSIQTAFDNGVLDARDVPAAGVRPTMPATTLPGSSTGANANRQPG